MESLNTFVGLLCMTWLIVTGAAPIQFSKKLLNIHGDSTPKSIYLKVLRELFNCSLCTGFWVGLIFYSFNGHHHAMLMACEVSMAAEFFARAVSVLFNKHLNQL